MPFSYVGGNSSSGYSVSADIVHGLTISEGDLLVVHVNRNDEKLISSTGGGTSWNEAIQVMPPPTETASQAVYWKVAGASEPASYSFELNVLSGSEDEYAITIHQFSVTGGTPQIELAATSNHNATSSPNLAAQAHAGRVNLAGSLSIVAAGKDREQAGQTWTAVSEGFSGTQGSGDGRSTGTAYKIHSVEETINNDVIFTASGASGSDATYSIHVSFSITGADTTAPILSSPTGSSTGETTADGTVSTDEGNGTLYYYASTNTSETAATIKASGSSQAVSVSGVQNVSFTGLTASTTYYAHYVQDDAESNESNVVSSAAFTTDSPALSITPSTTTPTEGDTVTVTISEGAGPYAATLNGDAITIDSQDAASATITWPDIKTFGSKNQSYETAYALVFTDTSDSDADSVNMTTQIPAGHSHAVITATTGIYADDVGAAVGDRAYGYWVSGTGSADLTVGAINSDLGGTFRYWIQDDTDGVWGASADEVLSAADVTPDQFDLGLDVTGSEPSATVQRTFTILGIDSGETVNITALGSATLSSATGQLNDVITVTLVSGGAFDDVVSGGAEISGVSDTFSITNRSAVAPTVQTQPTNQTVDEGQVVTFTAAFNNAVSYQWYDASDDSALVGETAATLDFATVLADNAKAYYCTATSADSLTVQTNTVTLTVNEVLIAPTMPADASVTVDENTTAVGTYVADSGSTPITYSLSGTDAASFNINSATGVVTFVSAPDYETKSSYSFTVVATNSEGSDSQIITLTVTNVVEQLPVINTGGDASITLTEGDVYSDPAWTASDDVGSVSITWSGAVDANTPGTYTRTATATNAIGSDTETYTVTVDAAPTGIVNDLIPRLLSTDTNEVTVFKGRGNRFKIVISHDGTPVDLSMFTSFELYGLRDTAILSSEVGAIDWADGNGQIFIDVGELATASGSVDTTLIGYSTEYPEGAVLWHPGLAQSSVTVNLIDA